jgi:putative redox protein
VSEVSAKLRRVDGLNFNVEVAEGRRIQLNSAEDMGHAFTPMELFLVSLAGCTAMDVQWILEKQRQKVEGLEISVRGVRREEDPAYYEKIYLEYSVRGQSIRKDAVERAIRLSQEKYCPVRAMIKETVKTHITYTIANGKGTEQKFVYPALSDETVE